MVSLELGASATLDPGTIGIGSNDGHGSRRRIQRQHRSIAPGGHSVGQQHNAGS